MTTGNSLQEIKAEHDKAEAHNKMKKMELVLRIESDTKKVTVAELYEVKKALEDAGYEVKISFLGGTITITKG